MESLNEEQIRLECLLIAASGESVTPEQIIKDAKLYHEFITTVGAE